jgi:predicted nucleic acid-binding protein
MILVDTSIWIDHLSRKDDGLRDLLERGVVLSHAFVLGELMMGNLNRRGFVSRLMSSLPQSTIARQDEALRFVEEHSLYGVGIGYIDAHLLASVKLSAGARLWTRDKRLAKVAKELGVAFQR